MKPPKLKLKKEKRVKAWAVLLDEGDGFLPVAITFKTRTLLMDNIPRNMKTKVVGCVITYKS